MAQAERFNQEILRHFVPLNDDLDAVGSFGCALNDDLDAVGSFDCVLAGEFGGGWIFRLLSE